MLSLLLYDLLRLDKIESSGIVNFGWVGAKVLDCLITEQRSADTQWTGCPTLPCGNQPTLLSKPTNPTTHQTTNPPCLAKAKAKASLQTGTLPHHLSVVTKICMPAGKCSQRFYWKISAHSRAYFDGCHKKLTHN